jgi:osmotically inducible protein OsmC
MATRKSEAVWKGKLQSGKGTVKLGSGAFEGDYSFSSRFQQGEGTNPEELIAAAHAGCFSMALAHGLEQEGYMPERIHTTANVSIEKAENGFSIGHIELETEAKVPDIEEQTFMEQAEAAKTNCPVSKVLAGTEIKLQARLTK